MSEITLAKSYSPSEHEPSILARWQAAGCFHAEAKSAGEPYAIFIPPPNVTAALHLGHALNNTLQDILIRVARMRGMNALWVPGTDHAGIATQSVVEKRLALQGKRRTDFTRETFVAKVQEWKDEYEAVILSQLRSMGASCDEARTRFTMDPVCTAAVREAFFRLFQDGLIERGKRIVNWDPVSQTALADDEVEMEEVDGFFWYLRYPLEDGSGHITVATTRPETMLGDTAVGINPRDPRAAALRGKSVRLPIVGRVIPIVEDDYVVMPAAMGGDPADAKAEFATGFLKVTPAHDANDFEIGRRHALEAINVLAPDGSISDRHGWSDVSAHAKQFVGLSREDARTAIVAWFKAQGLLESVKPYRHGVGHSYRSHVPVEPYLSDQWYVRVTDPRLSASALRSMNPAQFDGTQVSSQGGARGGDGELTFFPARYAKTFQHWHEGIRDWCISRQLWWGHRIPVWSRIVDSSAPPSASQWTARGAAEMRRTLPDGRIEIFVCIPESLDATLIPALVESGFTQDADVLDTWFSSALWPMSTLGWPNPARFAMDGMLETFNPSAVLSTAREIITLWVSRMVMFNRYFLNGRLPFRHVFIHCVVQDGFGQKMSKSLGNGVDPRDIIATHGSDAMRFVLTQISTATQDVRLPVDVLCPFTNETFSPTTITTPAGQVVAAPIQSCPTDPTRKMVTAFGASTGAVTATTEMPLARNSSARFDIGRNFATKLWNASRFALAQLGTTATPAHDVVPIALADRWILSRFTRTVQRIEESLAQYQFNPIAEALYEFVWRDFCDWYLEAIKPTVKSDPVQQAVLRAVMDGILRIMHPVMPFVTEVLWTAVQSVPAMSVRGLDLPASALATQARWPVPSTALNDGQAIAAFERVQALVVAIRNIRGERKVNDRRRIVLHALPEIMRIIDEAGGIVETLAGLERVEVVASNRPADAVGFSFAGCELFVSALAEALDVDAERTRLEAIIADRSRAVGGFEGKLSNPGYLAKAKPEVVEQTRRMLSEAQADLAAGRRALELLASSV
ncbi:MAG: valine--tRNA ligase [Phycisphaerales bacterium]|nr:valine--tRNA ligase [Phycisphaerales bacterium]